MTKGRIGPSSPQPPSLPALSSPTHHLLSGFHTISNVTQCLVKALFYLQVLAVITSFSPTLSTYSVIWWPVAMVEGKLLVQGNNVTFQDRLAAFGPRLADEGLSGTLMSISSLVPQLDDAGCEPFVGPSEKWIALVQRGRCAFVDKIRAMQASGAHSVVVGDSSPNSGLITMFAAGNTSDVQIPSVFVSWDAFQYLRAETHKKGPRGDIEITLYPNDLDVPITEIIIVTVVSPGAVMLCMYLIWRYRRYRQRQQELAPLNVVHDLPTRVYAAEDDQNRCPICLDAFAEGDVLRVLLCRHEYHVVCVDKWLTQHKRLCPICKQDISPKEALETTPLLSGASGSNDNNV